MVLWTKGIASDGEGKLNRSVSLRGTQWAAVERRVTRSVRTSGRQSGRGRVRTPPHWGWTRSTLTLFITSKFGGRFGLQNIPKLDPRLLGHNTESFGSSHHDHSTSDPCLIDLRARSSRDSSHLKVISNAGLVDIASVQPQLHKQPVIPKSTGPIVSLLLHLSIAPISAQQECLSDRHF